MLSMCHQVDFVVEGSREVRVMTTMNVFIVPLQSISLSTVWTARYQSRNGV